ncbi:hypothetical protein Bbelb_437650 [Branchiostoma belcheri]|nr:hypothetical protein Bbelb_439400 [Branchiostoma belcheri]KAI8478500.1 hypothetical protein Bbelb_437650 [Branchiostoma belcheri]
MCFQARDNGSGYFEQQGSLLPYLCLPLHLNNDPRKPTQQKGSGGGTEKGNRSGVVSAVCEAVFGADQTPPPHGSITIPVIPGTSTTTPRTKTANVPENPLLCFLQET